MQLNHNPHTLVIGGQASPTLHSAQILATPQMFKVLYDQVYTRKEEAVVRELLCNAWDSHVVQGTTDIPIEIHLPTTLEPWFEIKDFGTGLSPQDVINLYMNYGASNKTHTNSLIGGFGLGSKTPFAYTDQFTVQSRWHGTEYSFQAMLQPDGTPACIQTTSQPTSEPNGLTVYVPTKASSASCEFANTLKALLPYIPTAPIKNLPLNVEKKGPEFAFEFDVAGGLKKVEIHSRQGHRHWESPSLAVIMGLVPYGIDSNDVINLYQGIYRDTNIPSVIRSFIQKSEKTFDLKFFAEVGSCTVTVSRERLSQDQHTKTMLRRFLEAAWTALYNKLCQELDDAPNAYRWAQAAWNLHVGLATPARLGSFQKYTNWIKLHNDHATLNWENILSGPLQGAKPYVYNSRARVRRFTVAEAKHLRDGPNALPEKIFVAPNRKYVTSRFAEQHFTSKSANTSGYEIRPIICLMGDIDAVKAHVDTIGLPIDVEPMPLIARAARASSTNLGGATEYPIYLHDARTFQGFSSKSTTAEAFIKELDDETYPPDETLVYIPLGDGKSHEIHFAKNGIKHRFLLPIEGLGITKLITIQLRATHTKVKEALEQELEALGYLTTDTPVFDLLRPDTTRIKRQALLSLRTSTTDLEWLESGERRSAIRNLARESPAKSAMNRLNALSLRCHHQLWGGCSKKSARHLTFAALEETFKEQFEVDLSNHKTAAHKLNKRRELTFKSLLTEVDQVLPGFREMPNRSRYHIAEWLEPILSRAYSNLLTQRTDSA